MLTSPEIIERRPQHYIAVRRSVRIPFGDVVAPAYDEIFAALSQAGLRSDGVEFIRYNRVAMPDLDIEIGIMTDERPPLTGTVIEGVLPGGRYAKLTHTGPYEQLMDANRVLIEWAREHDVRWDSRQEVDGEHFAARLEIYANNPSIEPDPNRLVTTLMFKISS